MEGKSNQPQVEEAQVKTHVTFEKVTKETKLPKLDSVPVGDRMGLFIKKLQFSSIACDVNMLDEKSMDFVIKKKAQLIELAEIVQNVKGMLVLETYALCFKVFASNVFRIISKISDTYDPDEDDPITDPAWTYLQHVYHFFLRFTESPEFNPNEAKAFLTKIFFNKLLASFASPDMNERENLKLVLHRLYGKFLGTRPSIRHAISIQFLEVAHNGLYLPGACEILEVMGSIINGFGTPIKQEHEQFLFQVLLPMHSTSSVKSYLPQLVYCVIQYLEKDESLAPRFIGCFLKRWPKCDTSKAVQFLSELEEIIDSISPAPFREAEEIICKRLGECIQSDCLQVSERALQFWDNEYFASLMEAGREVSVSIILPSLIHASKEHWSATVVTMANEIIENFVNKKKTLSVLLEEVKVKKEAAQEKRSTQDAQWATIEKMAKEKLKTKDFLLEREKSYYT